MELSELQQKIHTNYEGNVDYYAEADEDYLVRLGFIEDAIDDWETGGGDEVIEWPELKSTTTISLSSTVESYALASTVLKVTGQPKVVRADGSYLMLNYKPSWRYDQLVKLNIDANIYTTTGTIGAKYIKIRPIPTATEVSLVADIIARATRPTASTDKVEMSKPMFIVHRVVARLHELDGATDLMQYHDDEADKLLAQMKREAYISPEGNFTEFTVPGSTKRAFGI